MIELPEAVSISRQINETVAGKRISAVIAANTPHKLAWYYGDKAVYESLIAGRDIGRASPYGGLVEIEAGNARILMGEGVNVRFHRKDASRPAKHQLLVEFTDGCALSGSVQMYGGMGVFIEGQLDNKYYSIAKEKPFPLSPEFNEPYFNLMFSALGAGKLSMKALLATEQRIPGLGNGVLQDILFRSKLHPKKKAGSLLANQRAALFASVKETLRAMAAGGGRDTELDIFGNPGGYKTILSSKTAGKPCPLCGTAIRKEAYMGGNVYFCPQCQAE
jgi:formamidopyrimidine-DNA glycosylase